MYIGCPPEITWDDNIYNKYNYVFDLANYAYDDIEFIYFHPTMGSNCCPATSHPPVILGDSVNPEGVFEIVLNTGAPNANDLGIYGVDYTIDTTHYPEYSIIKIPNTSTEIYQ